MDKKIKDRNLAALTSLGEILLEKMDPALLGVGSRQIEDFLARVGESAKRVTDEDGNPLRWQDQVIEAEIPRESSVLDLGCGEGELLARLMEVKQVQGQGVELDPGRVLACIRRGVPVLQADLDEGLKGFGDASFDCVVLEETLQTLVRPVEVLKEMLRVGKRGFVSFPNFGYWRVRLDLAIRGRMPRTEWLPYSWYDTPNIHLFSIQDFLDWCRSEGVVVVGGYVLTEGKIRELRLYDNLYAEEAMIIIERRAPA